MNEEMQQELMVPQFMTICDNDGVVELHLRGDFTSPRDNTHGLAQLHAMSSEYDTIRVFINSDGGNVHTMVDIMSVLKMFKTVVTIGVGSIASCGFMLWCVGDIRVIQPHTLVMAHRESYTLSGTTKNHKVVSSHSDILYGRLLTEMCGHILSEDEIAHCENNDLYLLPEELVKRGAIYWDDYVDRTKSSESITPIEAFMMDGVMFMVTPDGLSAVKEVVLGDVDEYEQFVYNTTEYSDEWFFDSQTVFDSENYEENYEAMKLLEKCNE